MKGLRSDLSEDRSEGPVEKPGEWAIVVVNLAANPSLGSGLVTREGVDWGCAPRVRVIAVGAVGSLFKLGALIEV